MGLRFLLLYKGNQTKIAGSQVLIICFEDICPSQCMDLDISFNKREVC